MPVIDRSPDRQRSTTDRAPSALAQFGEWPYGIARLGVIICVVIALATVARMYFSDSLSGSDFWATRNSSLDYMTRSVPFADVVGSPRVIEDARLWMPEDAAYRIEKGDDLEGPLDWAAPGFIEGFLFPRRQVDADDAPWVFCFRCDAASLGDDFVSLSEGEDGVLFGRIDR